MRRRFVGMAAAFFAAAIARAQTPEQTGQACQLDAIDNSDGHEGGLIWASFHARLHAGNGQERRFAGWVCEKHFYRMRD